VEARSSYSKPADAESLESPDSSFRKGGFDILMSSVVEDEERRLADTCTCQVFDRSEVSRADLLNPTQKSAQTTASSYQIEQEMYLIPIRHWQMHIIGWYIYPGTCVDPRMNHE
jgi:hypothetical protein